MSSQTFLESIPTSKKNAIRAFPKHKLLFIVERANYWSSYPILKEIITAKELIHALQCSSTSVEQFDKYCREYDQLKYYYKPQSKYAVLIANQKYKFYTELFTPITDCVTLKTKLVALGFITILITDTNSTELKTVLQTIYNGIPEDSYVLTYYAGHGCQICNPEANCINCILGTECPTESITLDHCVTENFILQEMSNSKPELGILMMDMCRLDLYRENNRTIYEEIATVPKYTVTKNLIRTFSTESTESAFEEVECSDSVSLCSNGLYKKQPGDTGRIRPTSSQYCQALQVHLTNYRLDVNSVIDYVHIDVKKSGKQKPLKLITPNVMPKYSFYDPVRGNTTEIANNLQTKLAALELRTPCSIDVP